MKRLRKGQHSSSMMPRPTDCSLDIPAGSRWRSTLTHGYLPFAAISLALHLYKGYHFLLMARAGERDFQVMDDAFMGGIHTLRYGIYAVVHSGMGITLGVFLVALWRSLGRKDQQPE